MIIYILALGLLVQYLQFLHMSAVSESYNSGHGKETFIISHWASILPILIRGYYLL